MTIAVWTKKSLDQLGVIKLNSQRPTAQRLPKHFNGIKLIKNGYENNMYYFCLTSRQDLSRRRIRRHIIHTQYCGKLSLVVALVHGSANNICSTFRGCT